MPLHSPDDRLRDETQAERDTRLLKQIGDARFVLIGEASHGKHDFYAERARITQLLVQERSFEAVAAEADWPDALRVNRSIRDRDARPAPDLVQRKFIGAAPNELWVADITYIPTDAGFLFLAVVLDAYSRRIVGWVTSSNIRTQLVLDALNMAIQRRRPDNVVHHSDRGTQYTSIAFGSRCREANVRPSMGSVGDCYDNAMCESFNATLECELLDRHRFRTHAEAQLAIFDFGVTFQSQFIHGIRATSLTAQGLNEKVVPAL
jgi:transposase InsO family protein